MRLKIKSFLPFCSIVYFGIIAVLFFGCQQESSNSLRISEINPRYFTNNSGKAIYLTGSHTWDNLVDMHNPGEETPFDYQAYLKFLKSYNHNFIRMWTWDLLTMGKEDFLPSHHIPFHPWERSGEEMALDGMPKFDLTKFNTAYFDRMRERVEAAGKEGIYVSVMLFEGWGLQFSINAYKNHPFHASNNVNQLELDTAQDSRLSIYDLGNDKLTRLQENYVDKVIETVGDLDNVLYEISNENHAGSTEWQYHMISYIKEQEEKRGKLHPVGMTYQHKGGTNEDLFDSPADWISPNPLGGYRDHPPVATGQKVILNDTDHLWGIGGNRQWVWKSFLRGLNPIFMDPYKDQVFDTNRDELWKTIRTSMGHSLEFARKMDLINMIPDSTLATSGYCLASVGKEYLVYLPEQNETALDLTATEGTFDLSWFDSNHGESRAGSPLKGGTIVTLISPFDSTGAVAHLRLQGLR